MVEQSGRVTAGHLAVWTADGVIGDGGPLTSSTKVIARMLSVDFNDLADVPLVLPQAVSVFKLQQIFITNASVSLTTAVGGFYPQASKAGTAIVAAGQVYTSLTTSSMLLIATLAGNAATTRFTRANLPDWAIYFSLTTPQGAAATADIYITATDLSP